MGESRVLHKNKFVVQQSTTRLVCTNSSCQIQMKPFVKAGPLEENLHDTAVYMQLSKYGQIHEYYYYCCLLM